MPAAGAFRAFGAADLRAIDEGHMNTLDEILNDKPEPAEQLRDEQGRFAAPEREEETPEPETVDNPEPAAKAPEPESVPTTQPQEPDRVPFAALRDERQKRQQLEAEVAQYRAQAAQPQQPAFQQPQGPVEAPDMFADPEGYTQFIMQRAADEAFQRAMEAQRFERVKQSNAAAMQRHADYLDVIDTYKQLATANPSLDAMMVQQTDPAEWAYQTAKTHLEVSNYGGLEAAINARVEAEIAKRTAAQQAQSPPLPKATLADAQSARTDAVTFAPPTLNDILFRK